MIHPKLKRKQRIVLVTAIIVLCLAIVWNLTTGEYAMSYRRIIQTFLGQGNAADQLILIDFRLPRMLITLMAGIALSLSGVILQSVTKNPLAEPGILGINAGSGFAIALFIAIGQIQADQFVYVLPIISMVGGLLTAFAIFILSYQGDKGLSPASMVLIGVGMSTALSGAALTLMSTFDKDQSEFIATWLAGNIWGDTWPFVFAFLPWLIILVPIVIFQSETLNILNTSDTIAKSVGVPLNKARILLILIAVLLSSAAVSVAGAIGFIGLMGPHIAKSMVGPRHQLFIPISIVIGALLLTVSDTLGKILLQPSGVPAGLVVAVIGAPYFLYLMYRTRSV
ncbi:FecCD family ABC transporter permease [Staphylococcus schleiferi]|uniref:Probable heme-iron transport system permease protein IsdF n=1 Tax=Staphylococcus schleiferi TaxID=1295 RepID=A0A7Z7QRL4_STASC|nr:iron ABC transporter permease [Staphylococcus schleiferi]QGS46874.1 iron chelate uptake ABC transporter family permease subunit [Mammaliicoccus fleurettii]NHA33901.1 iron ABC transporter permease [Staphylococcus schleiferi]NHA38448.1 iron ABC transporter permease [Staphylococcus schleiferi]NHA40564.1 iron ABC transporter permease [Staphylococcus schleiferi]NHA43819.1 iron ABC transporter permease [Staphylococcus schleiferi]